MKLALKILAYIVAILGWVIIAALIFSLVVLYAVGIYMKVVEVGLWEVAKTAGIWVGIILGFVALVVGWCAAQKYIGWSDDR